MYALIFLLRFLIAQHNYTANKMSEMLTKAVKMLIGKLCYLPFNREFKHMNSFLILYKLIVKEKEFFGEARIKAHLAVQVSQKFFIDNRTYFCDNIVEEYCHMIMNDEMFADSRKELPESFSQIASLTLLTQNASQLLSYGSPFN